MISCVGIIKTVTVLSLVRLLFLFGLLCQTSVAASNVTTTPKKTERDLMRHLFADYDNRSRPVKDPATSVLVEANYKLVAIDDLNEKEEKLSAFGWFNLKWEDEYLVWDPDQWSGIRKIIVPSQLVWVPDIVIRNSAKNLRGEVVDENKSYRYILYSNGTLLAWTAGDTTTFCAIDVTYFPFDDQACHIGIDSWSYSINEVTLTFAHDRLVMDMYEESCQWSVLGTNVRRIVDVFQENGVGVKFSNLRLEVFLRRKPLFYVYNIILPSVLLSLLVLLIFLLPADAGEKVSLGVTILLSFTVFQLVIADSLPKSSENMPVIVLYILWTMGLTTVSVVVSVLVLAIHYRDERWSPPGPCLRKTLLFVARLLRMNTSLQPSRPQTQSSQYTHPVSSLGGDVTHKNTLDRTSIAMQANNHLCSQEEQLASSVNGASAAMIGGETTTSSRTVDKSEWVEVARIVDRGLFVLFFVVIVAATVIMVGIYPLTKPKMPTIRYV